MLIPKLAIIVPCYNEAPAVGQTARCLVGILGGMKSAGEVSEDSFILFVDDGSTDATAACLEALCADFSSDVEVLVLSGNRGHQAAIIAGLDAVRGECDAAVTIDADMQDPPEVIREMVSRYGEGADIVFGVRNDRATDGAFKRLTARWYYRVLGSLGVDCVADHADFRLLSRRALEALGLYGERCLYLRGIVAQMGFRTAEVSYARQRRVAGVTKYPLGKMMEFAADGITSFSVRPVRFVSAVGVVFILVSLGIAIYTLIRYFGGHTVPGWTSMILSVWFCSGMVLVCLGVVGEYVGKIYTEVKQRPRYHVLSRRRRKS